MRRFFFVLLMAPCFLAAADTPPPTTRARSALTVTSDAPCSLVIEGESHGRLEANEPRTFEVKPGRNLVSCMGASRASTESWPRVPSGATVDLKLELSARINALLSELQARYTAVDRAVLRDTRTALEWTRQDNGEDIDWRSADSYCRDLAVLGGGWRLPTMMELVELYDDSDTLSASCGDARCAVSPLLNLTSHWYWSSELKGDPSSHLSTDRGTSQTRGRVAARYFSLSSRGRYTSTPEQNRFPRNLRALCVR
jgi:hypothetical protein